MSIEQLFEPHFYDNQEYVERVSRAISKSKNAESLITDLMISLTNEVDEEYGRLINIFVEDHLIPYQVSHNLV